MRISSACFSQSNGRAEAALPSAKCMIRDNIRGDGSLDTDAYVKALLQHRNTPIRDIDKSTLPMALGRQLRDSVPLFRKYYLPD